MVRRPVVVGIAYLGGMFAWLLSVPLFGPVWFRLGAAAGMDTLVPVYLFLTGHALGLLAFGLAADAWPSFRDAGLRWSGLVALILSLIVGFAPVIATVVFPLLGAVAAWGIVAWTPVFGRLVPVGRRALLFALVPVFANGVKSLLSLGWPTISPAALMVLAVTPLLLTIFTGRRLVRELEREPASEAMRSGGFIPGEALRPLWLLAPFLFVVYLAAGVSYSAVTPALLRVTHSRVEFNLIAYSALMPLLGLLSDRTSLRNVALLGPLLLGAAFLVWAVSPTEAGAIWVQVLMGSGYAVMDLLTWIALLEIAPRNGFATVFGIGLNANVLPILIGAGLQARLPVLERLPTQDLAAGMAFLMVVAMAFFQGTSLLSRASLAGDAHNGVTEQGDTPTHDADWTALVCARLQSIADTPLSQRELEVALLVVQGRSVQQVAQELVVSQNTVKTHLAKVYRKTNSHGRTGLTARVLVENR